MCKNFSKKDLDNISYSETNYANFNGLAYEMWSFNDGFNALYTEWADGSFPFVLKDGRKFYCKQDLDHVFTIHSENYGDVEGNLWVKLAADAINDNDKFVNIVETIKNSADYVGKLCSWSPSADRLVTDGMLQILVQHNGGTLKTLFIELIKMGLDKKNKFVTIVAATNKD